MKIKEKLDEYGERWKWFGTVLAVQKRYSELNGNYLASAVTLTAFLSIFPLLLVAIAIVGFVAAGKADFSADVIEYLGITDDARDSITRALDTARDSRRLASVIGIVGLLWSGLGLVAAVQYAINAAWQVAGRGWRDKLKGLTWLAGAALLFATSFATSTVISVLPKFLAPLTVLAALSLNLGMWLWTFKILSTRDIDWKSLLPGAVVAAIGLEILKSIGAFYVPWAITNASALYGTLGVVFATLAWLLFFGRLVVYAAVVNVIQWEEHHGTVTLEMEVPKVKGDTTEPVDVTRAGETKPHEAAAGV